MQRVEFGEFVQIDFQRFLNQSSHLRCEATGIVTSISSHKKYIIQVMRGNQAVIRTYKRFTEFESFYELLYRFPTHSLAEFPSRMQIFGKDETRKQFFSNLLNQIIQDYNNPNRPSSEYKMKLLFDFLSDRIMQDKIRKAKKAKKKRQGINNKQNLAYQVETDAKSESGKRVIKKSMYQKSEGQDQTYERISQAQVQLSALQTGSQRPLSCSATWLFRIFNKAPELQENVYDNQFQIKFANEEQWKTGFIEIKDSTMYVFKTKFDNRFKTCIELYQINVKFFTRDINLFEQISQRLQLSSPRIFKQNQDILSLYHDYDCNKILIRKPCPQEVSSQVDRFNILNLKDQIVEASHKQPHAEHFQGVFNPIGKVFIFLHKIKCNWQENQPKMTIQIRIKTEAFIYHATPFSYSSEVQINQGFIIPISNIFQKISIQCYTGKTKKESGGQVGVFKFNMVEFFIKFQRFLIKQLQVNMEPVQKKQDFKTKLQVSLENLSDLSSIYSNSYLSERDGMKKKQFQNLEDMDDFTLPIKRILHIVGKVSLFFRAFRRNVMRFKYPILGYAFFLWLMINVAFIPLTYFLKEIIVFILFVILYQHKHAHLIIQYMSGKYIFQHLHPFFRIPEVLSTDQVTDLKWSYQMQQIIQDYQFCDGRIEKKSSPVRTKYEFKVHDRLFVVQEEQLSFFEKLQTAGKILNTIYQVLNIVAFTIEKIVNLYSWVDFRKTIIICIAIFISSGFTSVSLIQLLICVICGAKLINGTAYYQRKHYAWNRRFAVYSLRYILLKKFPDIIGHTYIHRDMNYVELNDYLSNLSFPISNQSAQKNLASQMDRIMGIYLEVEAVMKKAPKQNEIKLVYLLDMIETCEKRLILNFVPGEQGLSNQFQQLIRETKDVQDFDDWIAETIRNFILNVPSQLFMIFHRSQLHKIQNAETQHQKSKLENLQKVKIIEEKKLVNNLIKVQGSQINKQL